MRDNGNSVRSGAASRFVEEARSASKHMVDKGSVPPTAGTSAKGEPKPSHPAEQTMAQ